MYATHYDLACKINKKDGKVVVTYNSGGRRYERAIQRGGGRDSKGV